MSLFSPEYVAPRSVRSNLQWNGNILANRFTLNVDGTYSLWTSGTRQVPADVDMPNVQGVDELYRRFKDRQLRVARAALAGEPASLPEVRFAEELYEPFYGGRQFSVRDLNDITLVFYQR